MLRCVNSCAHRVFATVSAVPWCRSRAPTAPVSQERACLPAWVTSVSGVLAGRPASVAASVHPDGVLTLHPHRPPSGARDAMAPRPVVHRLTGRHPAKWYAYGLPRPRPSPGLCPNRCRAGGLQWATPDLWARQGSRSCPSHWSPWSDTDTREVRGARLAGRPRTPTPVLYCASQLLAPAAHTWYGQHERIDCERHSPDCRHGLSSTTADARERCRTDVAITAGALDGPQSRRAGTALLYGGSCTR